MKKGWKVTKMIEVFELQMGKTPSRDNPAYWGGTEPWVSIGDMGASKFILSTKENITNQAVIDSGIKLVPKGTVIMSFKLSVGKVAIAAKPLYTNEAIMSFKPRGGFSLSSDYIYYYLKGYKWDGVNRAAMGLTLNKASISQGQFAFPSLSEQERIVAELDLLQGIIDKQKAQLKELDTLAQSIFYDMFGDPVMNDRHWDTARLGSCCTSVSYGTSAPSSAEGEYVYLRMNNITYDGQLDLRDVKYISVSETDFEKYAVKEGDVLFNRTNSADLVGKTTWMHGHKPMIIAGYIIRVRLNERLLPGFVSAFMNTKEMKVVLKAMGKGAVNQSNINSKELQSILTPIPPLPLQQAFATKIEAIERQKASINASIAETQKLFDYTMDKYFG